MKKEDFKKNTVNYLYNLIDGWFPKQGFQDSMVNASLKTIIEANQNKYDGIIDLFTDEKGNVLTERLIDNVADTLKNQKIDIREFVSNNFNGGIAKFLPNKILLFTDDDIELLKKLLK